MSGSKEHVTINTEPAGARIVINGKDQNAVTPAVLNVRKRGRVNYVFTKEGYENGNYTDAASVNGWIFGNILIGGIPGLAIDAATGAMYNIENNVYRKLTPAVSQNGRTVRVGEAQNMVTRDAPGQTSLERTIVRWFFDSAPRGARIFWRVISSVPDQVKNTNELYLTTTPYEETRSFNILGLTYENSRDVTIEIKVSMPGHHDQVKRYNVRQAIDQQEMSGFFDLVKVAE